MPNRIDHSRHLRSRLQPIGYVLVVLLLSACAPTDPQQRPSVWQQPLAYWQLGREPLPAQLPVPVQGIRPAQLGDTWGAARSGGRQHQGIDIFAQKGTPVLANTHGVILSVGQNSLGGQVVWLLGPDMTRHYYAHLSEYGSYQAGDWVIAGDILGYVGNTGNARTTPPHLHYGIYRNGQGAINPYPLLTSRSTTSR